MSLREYHRALMKEAASSSSSSSSSSTSSGNSGSRDGERSSSSSPISNGDVMNMRVEHVLVLRLEEKWESVVAHVTMVVLEKSRELVASLQIVLYAASACLVLYGTAQLIKALRAPAAPSSASSASSSASSKPNK